MKELPEDIKILKEKRENINSQIIDLTKQFDEVNYEITEKLNEEFPKYFDIYKEDRYYVKLGNYCFDNYLQIARVNKVKSDFEKHFIYAMEYEYREIEGDPRFTAEVSSYFAFNISYSPNKYLTQEEFKGLLQLIYKNLTFGDLSNEDIFNYVKDRMNKEEDNDQEY